MNAIDREQVSGATPARRRRWRWLLLLLLLPIAAMLLLRWALQPERLGALLLARAATATGLELTVTEPARLGIWPRLQLELVGLRAGLPGRGALLAAERVDVALPIALLWRREVEIAALELRAPQFDLREWQHWQAADLDAGPPPPPTLPEFAADIGVERGRLLGDGWQLEDIALDASPLRDGRIFAARLGLALQQGGRRLPLLLALEGLPRQRRDGIAVESLQLGLGDGGPPLLQLGGDGALDAMRRIELRLSGTVDERWPPRWPQPPTLLRQQLAAAPLRIDFRGSSDLDGRLHIEQDADGFRLSGNPRGLIAWLADEARPPLPPLDGRARLDRLELDGVVIGGLELELTAPTPAPTDSEQ